MDETRIYGAAVDIDSESVKAFYNERARMLKDSLSTVNLQTNAEASQKRDLYEKEQIIPKLNLSLADNVFEFGCGFGRFAEALAGKVGSYLGVDISDELIKIAKSKFDNHAGFKFIEGDVSKIQNSSEIICGSHTLLMTMGVLMYLNDSEVEKVLNLFCKLSAPNAKIYIRESVTLIPQRLTLNGFWSENLQQSYTAIYRTVPEYEKLFQLLTNNGFQLKESDLAYPPVPENAETTPIYFIFTK